MEQLTLKAEKRTAGENQTPRKLLKSNRIPGVLYNRKENFCIVIDRNNFEPVFKQAGTSHIFNLLLDNEPKKAFVKDYYIHPVSRQINHLDLYLVNENEPVTISIAVKTVNTPAGVKMGGVLEHFAWQIKVRCLPADIPETVEIDIGHLNIGEDIFVRDIKLKENVTIIDNPDKIIVGVVGATKEDEPKPAEVQAAETAGQPAAETAQKDDAKETKKEDKKEVKKETKKEKK
ncbi:MAG: hypothetical protein A2096_09680 [Spirochaetes bacterium GWF1_41_5]|nr:MAG: hypothetical protein A2096_09680 [Spirochaetes bacterium GWF1_41_5]HBE03253.1 50S ribosomal protein L25 [Spirochaetia bacterium]